MSKLSRRSTILALVLIISSIMFVTFLREHKTAEADDGVMLPWTIADKRTTQQGQSPNYQILIDQPVLESSIGLVESFNQAVDDFVKQSTDSFMSMSASNKPLPTEIAAQSNRLTIWYDVLATSHGIISVQLNEEVAPVLSANYDYHNKSITYDITNSKLLQLQDMFKSDVHYLQALSNYVSAELKRENRLDFPENVLPNLELNPVWNLAPGGVLITFDQDTVSGHPMGPSTVFVPFTALPDDFREDWPRLYR